MNQKANNIKFLYNVIINHKNECIVRMFNVVIIVHSSYLVMLHENELVKGNHTCCFQYC